MSTTTTSEPSDPPAALPALPATVDGDLACLRCRYNLRTLPTSSACPECGTPIATTLGAGLLMGRPHWLLTLIRGAGWLFAVILTAPLLLLVGFVNFAYSLGWGSSTGSATFIVLLGVLATFTLWPIGVEKLATPEPNGSEPPSEQLFRELLARTPVLTFALFALLFGMLGLGSETLLVAGLVLLPWGNLMVLAARLRGLFRQLSAPDLARKAGGLMGLLWAGLAALGLALLVGATGTPSLVLLGLVVGGVVAFVAATASSLGLLIALRRQARQALWAPGRGAKAGDRSDGHTL